MMPESPATPTLHSARSPDVHNPYALFKCCCRHVRIQEIIRPVGILSFIVFLAASIMLGIILQWATLLPLIIGAVVYGLLFQSVTKMANKTYVLTYVVYELFTVGMFLVLLTMIIMIVTAPPPKGEQLDTRGLFNIAIIYSIYIVLKLYFATVFIQFYRYMSFSESRLQQVYAQYVNGGIQINANEIFPPPPAFTPANIPADHPTRDPSYGYAIPYTNTTLTQVPNYSDAISMRKEPPPAASMA
ncbi:hypothetical protein QR680_007981 [Steinernema hermaphroditum]|uniref:Uncharacterized protein n=1 Tax=Steinernema hermaphroditum TaxID=289476 RepID=A0AA39IGB6_9BILA|nr:hypothetical protein QR680_007981 [Steinernema hermaphroditum]